MENDMSHLAVAGLQLELGVEDNLSLIEQEIDLVKKRFPWIQMVVLPELAVYGPSSEMAIKMPGEVESCLQESARKSEIWLIPGSLFEQRDGKIFNTTPVINPGGEVVARYSKHYPFLPYEKGIERGDGFVVFDVPGVGRLGVMICYDMWYPEMSRQLAWMGAEAIIVPTLTNTNDRHLELHMAQANATINQLYVVNINSAGRMGYGRSIVAGPDGNIVHQASSSREIITMDLDFDHVRRVRERGIHGLAQPLKSFRDAGITYPVYQENAGPGAFGELGVHKVPGRD